MRESVTGTSPAEWPDVLAAVTHRIPEPHGRGWLQGPRCHRGEIDHRIAVTIEPTTDSQASGRSDLERGTW
jgi:hypothetical protein